MIELKVNVGNIDRIRENFARSPRTMVKLLGNAVAASIEEIHKQAIDRNFQFKTPRGQRTGRLQQSFAFGRYLSPNRLKGSIGPTALYAPYVYFGTSRGIKPNPYMDRIARAAEPQVNKYFNDALEGAVDDLIS